MDNNKLAEKFIERQVKLFRHQASMRAHISDLINALGATLAERLLSADLTVGLVDLRVQGLIDASRQDILRQYPIINDYSVEQLAGVAMAEAGFVSRDIMKVMNADRLALEARRVQFIRMVDEKVILGAPMKEWWARQGDNLSKQYADIIRTAMVNETPMAEVVKLVRGTRAAKYSDGLMGVGNRWARALVRSSHNAITTATREQIASENAGLFDGYQQVSVFDGRTSDTCIAYAGKVWDLDKKPVGHKLPYNGGTPRHPNCRSSIITLLKGDKPEDLSFESYLKGKSKTFTEDLLGKGRAERYLSGKITLNDLVDQNGRALTLEQLDA